jgi:dipeptide/tripeptide permease
MKNNPNQDQAESKLRTLKQVLATYLGVAALSVISGALLAMILTDTTTTIIKFGLAMLQVGAGYLFSILFTRLARGYEHEAHSVHAIAPLMAMVLLVPAVVVSLLFGIL